MGDGSYAQLHGMRGLGRDHPAMVVVETSNDDLIWVGSRWEASMKRKLGGSADLGRSWLLLEEEDIFSRKDAEESSLQAGGREIFLVGTQYPRFKNKVEWSVISDDFLLYLVTCATYFMLVIVY